MPSIEVGQKLALNRILPGSFLRSAAKVAVGQLALIMLFSAGIAGGIRGVSDGNRLSAADQTAPGPALLRLPWS